MVSIFIACLGIFGLVSYTAEQKTKEIGIRKVLGASVQNIIKLLSREFVLLITIASILAFPAAYLILRNLLMEFAFRTSIGFDVFIISGGIALILALITISYQSARAASANPADTLRYE
jgi:putative ABC transport system permease protein